MRYIHGRKPRNPLDMIIQENHVAGRASTIISYLTPRWQLMSGNYVEKLQDAVGAVYHKTRENVAKEEDK